MDKFLKLFAGMNLDEAFQEQLKAAFNDAVAAKQSKLKEGAELCEKCKEAVAENVDAELCEACKAKMTTEAEEMPVAEPGVADTDPADLVKDMDIRKILTALKINPTEFARSLKAAQTDVKGNMLGDDSFIALMEILQAIANDPQLATRLALKLKDAVKDEAEPVQEEDEEEKIEEITEQLVNKVDRYLSYIAEEWMEQNALAVENGLKVELLESFLGGLKNLYEEHNINIPEDESIVTKMQAQIGELQTKLNEETEKTITLTEEINKAKEEVVPDAEKTIEQLKEEKETVAQQLLEQKAINSFIAMTAGLPSTSIDKLKRLSEAMEFSTIEEHDSKLKVLIENVGQRKSSKKVLMEDQIKDEETVITEESNPTVDLYAKKISKDLKY